VRMGHTVTDTSSPALRVFGKSRVRYPLLPQALVNSMRLHPLPRVQVTLGEVPLPEPGAYSPELIEFVSLCMERDPADRPTALALLHHPWIQVSPLPRGIYESSLWFLQRRG
jgi:serine/threonine protein kinase